MGVWLVTFLANVYLPLSVYHMHGIDVLTAYGHSRYQGARLVYSTNILPPIVGFSESICFTYSTAERTVKFGV